MKRWRAGARCSQEGARQKRDLGGVLIEMNPESSSLDLDRRSFLRQSSGIAAGLGLGTLPIIGAEKKKPTSETLVKTFYDSLSEEQRKKVCFPFDHKLRLKVENNWHITKTLVEDYSNL